MLDNTHKLYDPIAHFFDLGENILPEVVKSMNFFLNARHSNVALIYADAFVLPLRLGVFPFVVSLLHIHSIERAIWILTGIIDPSRNPVFFFPVGELYLDLDRRIFLDIDWHFTNPVTKIILVIGVSYLFAKVLASFPLIELPEERNAPSLRGPLPVDKPASLFVKTIFLVAL